MSSLHQPYYVLIVDDSELILSRVCDSLLHACQEQKVNYRFIKANKQGYFAVSHDSIHAFNPLQMVGGPEDGIFLPSGSNHQYDFIFFTATAPKYALPVISLNYIEKLTILCDIYMPSDTEIGILGLIEAISRRRLPVNLIFASSEYQNREIVQGFLKQQKAYFIEKGTAAWDGIPYALVTRAATFKYQYIMFEDARSRGLGKTAPLPSPIVAATAPSTKQSSTSSLRNNVTVPLENKQILPANPEEKSPEEANSRQKQSGFLNSVLNIAQNSPKENSGSKETPLPAEGLRHNVIDRFNRVTKFLGRRKNNE